MAPSLVIKGPVFIGPKQLPVGIFKMAAEWQNLSLRILIMIQKGDNVEMLLKYLTTFMSWLNNILSNVMWDHDLSPALLLTHNGSYVSNLACHLFNPGNPTVTFNHNPGVAQDELQFNTSGLV